MARGNTKDFPALVELDPNGDIEFVLDSKKLVVSPLTDINIETAEEAAEDAPNEEEKSKYKLGTGDIRIKVSSGVLKLVSPKFRAMFRCDMLESRELKQKGFVSIPLVDDSPDGLLALLQIIHHKHRLLPKTMQPGLLRQIAESMDRHDIPDVIPDQVMACWLVQLRDSIPQSYNDDCVVWLSVFHMLGHTDGATGIAKILQGNILDDFDDEGFIGPDLLERLQARRLEGIKIALSQVEEVLNRYKKGPRNVCTNDSRQCDMHLRAALNEGLEDAGLLPLPQGPYPGLSLQGLADKLANLQLQPICAIKARVRSCDRAGGKYDNPALATPQFAMQFIAKRLRAVADKVRAVEV